MPIRSRDFLMNELRVAQKQLVTAKKRKNSENEKYLRIHIAELQKEMAAVE